MDSERARVWGECLLLWETLSENEYQLDRSETVSDFKNRVIYGLGLPKRASGCPFCEEYFDTSNCPLGICNGVGDCFLPCLDGKDAPYRKWYGWVGLTRRNDRGLAKAFYDCLLKIHAKEVEEDV